MFLGVTSLQPEDSNFRHRTVIDNEGEWNEYKRIPTTESETTAAILN